MSSDNFDNFLEFKKKYNELVLIMHEISGDNRLKEYIENVNDANATDITANVYKSKNNQTTEPEYEECLSCQ